jgi:integrase
MARPRNKVPSYLPHKPSGQARVRIGDRDVYLGPFGSPKSKELYARLIAEHFAHGESRTIKVEAGERLCIAALVVKYDDFAKTYYVKNSIPTDERYAIKMAITPLVKLYGSTPADEFSPKRLKAVREEAINRGRKKDNSPLSRKYINYQTAIIVRMFRWAVEEELVPVTVYQSLKTVAGLKRGRTNRVREPKPIKPVPDEHIAPVLKQLSPQLAAVVQLQLYTGMRPDEVTIMRPCDIDRSGDIWAYRPQSHKTEHHGIDKTILLGPKAQEILTPWLNRESQQYLFSPKEVSEAKLAARLAKQPKRCSLFAKKKRKKRRKPFRVPRDRYDDESYCQAVERACKNAGVPKWTPGRLRHNAATKVRAMFGAEAAQLVLGHQNLSTTEIYAEKNHTQYEEIMKRIG